MIYGCSMSFTSMCEDSSGLNPKLNLLNPHSLLLIINQLITVEFSIFLKLMPRLMG